MKKNIVIILGVVILLLLGFLIYSKPIEHLDTTEQPTVKPDPTQCYNIMDGDYCNKVTDASGNQLCSYCMCASHDAGGEVSCGQQCVPYGQTCSATKNQDMKCYDEGDNENDSYCQCTQDNPGAGGTSGLCDYYNSSINTNQPNDSQLDDQQQQDDQQQDDTLDEPQPNDSEPSDSFGVY